MAEPLTKLWTSLVDDQRRNTSSFVPVARELVALPATAGWLTPEELQELHWLAAADMAGAVQVWLTGE